MFGYDYRVGLFQKYIASATIGQCSSNNDGWSAWRNSAHQRERLQRAINGGVFCRSDGVGKTYGSYQPPRLRNGHMALKTLVQRPLRSRGSSGTAPA
jgi:hypothetical protein